MVSCKQLNIKVEKDGRKGGEWEKAKERAKEKCFRSTNLGGNQLYSYASYCQKNKNDFP